MRLVLSVFAPCTGVLLTLSLYPQCSHSIHTRTDRYCQFHVSLPQLGQIIEPLVWRMGREDTGDGR